jgi:IS5 family transposase
MKQQTLTGFERYGKTTRRAQSVLASAANVADCLALQCLLHGKERRVWGDQAYRGQKAAIRAGAPRAKDFTNQRYRWGKRIDESVSSTAHFFVWTKQRNHHGPLRSPLEPQEVRLLVFGSVQIRKICPKPPGKYSRRTRKQATILARNGK